MRSSASSHSGDVAGVDLHLEQQKVFVAKTGVFARYRDPLGHGRTLGIEAGGDDHAREVVQGPGQEALVDLAAEDVAVDLYLGIQVEHIGDVDVGDAV